MMSDSTQHADVIVIGGGLHGCSAALNLAKRGVSAIVLEKDHTGRHASGLNAGGVRRLGRALAEIPLSVASAALWLGIEDLVGDDCGFRPVGQIKVAETEDELAALRQRVSKLQSLGFSHERMIDAETVRDLLPNATRACVGGIHVEGDGYADPEGTVAAFRRAGETNGVQFVEGSRAEHLSQEKGLWQVEAGGVHYEAPALVNCAGAWGGAFAATLGEGVPMRAAALMLAQTERMEAFVTPVVGAQGRKLSFKQLEDGSVVVGGGYEGQADPDTNETTLDDDALVLNMASAQAIFPVMKEAKIARAWAGIEGMMADGIPVIGPSREEGVFHAFGFSAHGFQLGPICGQIIADLVIDGATDLPIEPFRIDRSFEVPDAAVVQSVTMGAG